MRVSKTAGGVILNPKGEIALVRNGHQDPNWWGFPKGHLDPGEEALTAAKREIFEETGLADITLVRELGSYERYKGGMGGEDRSELKHIEMFLFTTGFSGPLTPQDHFNPEARWVPKDDVAGMLANPKDKEFFNSILSQL